ASSPSCAGNGRDPSTAICYWRTLVQIGGIRRICRPIHIPCTIDRNEDNGSCRGPSLMGHLGGHVIEAAWSHELNFASVIEGHAPLDDGVGFVGRVPMHRNVHLRWCTNQQLRCFGLWVDTKDCNLR